MVNFGNESELNEIAPQRRKKKQTKYFFHGKLNKVVFCVISTTHLNLISNEIIRDFHVKNISHREKSIKSIENHKMNPWNLISLCLTSIINFQYFSPLLRQKLNYRFEEKPYLQYPQTKYFEWKKKFGFKRPKSEKCEYF